MATSSSRDVKLCVIGLSSKTFTAHLATIRHMEGIKVLKRRNKPFYDVYGRIDEAAFYTMGNALARLMEECDAQIEIPDEATKKRLLNIIKPIIEG